MDDLVQWFGEQLDEDERIAREATPGPWRADSTIHTETIYGSGQTAVVAGGRWGGEASVFESDNDAAHIVRHDPARVLREIDAKRQSLAEYVAAGEAMDRAVRDGDTVGYNAARAEQRVLERVIRRDAAVHADRPGYLKKWRP